MSRLRYELELFLTALAFFTRIPVPKNLPWSPQRLNASTRYFPLVGWVVAAVCAAVLLVASDVLPPILAAILATAAGIRLTGAFHEDGWADSCDGFGAGWNRTQILTIMKDSRIGTYGASGLGLMLLAKVCALASLIEVSPSHAVIALCVAHALSRLAASTLIYTLEYVRDDDSSKSKPLSNALSRGELVWAAAFGLLPMLLLSPLSAVWVALGSVAVTLWCARVFVRRLGGYTGDCLGATQQVNELMVYLVLVGAWNSI